MPSPHGTESRYVNDWCRCGACRKAASAARRGRAQKDQRLYSRARGRAVTRLIRAHQREFRQLLFQEMQGERLEREQAAS